MGARRLCTPRLPPPPRRDFAHRRGEEAKKFLCGREGLRHADAAGAATPPPLAVLSGFLLAAPGHERASLPGVKEEFAGERREGRAGAAPRAGGYSRLQVCAGPRARAGCGALGRARGRRSAMGEPRLRAPAVALGLLLCAVLGRLGPAEGSGRGGPGALGQPSGAAAERRCPAPCRCLGDLLDCSRQRLARLPESLPPWVARL